MRSPPELAGGLDFVPRQDLDRLAHSFRFMEACELLMEVTNGLVACRCCHPAALLGALEMKCALLVEAHGLVPQQGVWDQFPAAMIS